MRRRLLLVEARPGCASHLAGRPGLESFEIAVIPSEAAVQAASSGPAPAAVVLAGTSDEWALAKELRALPALAGVPMVAVGGAAQSAAPVLAVRAGCERFLEEPCTAVELAVALDTLLEPMSRPTTRPSSPDEDV